MFFKCYCDSSLLNVASKRLYRIFNVGVYNNAKIDAYFGKF